MIELKKIKVVSTKVGMLVILSRREEVMSKRGPMRVSKIMDDVLSTDMVVATWCFPYMNSLRCTHLM